MEIKEPNMNNIEDFNSKNESKEHKKNVNMIIIFLFIFVGTYYAIYKYDLNNPIISPINIIEKGK